MGIRPGRCGWVPIRLGGVVMIGVMVRMRSVGVRMVGDRRDASVKQEALLEDKLHAVDRPIFWITPGLPPYWSTFANYSTGRAICNRQITIRRDKRNLALPAYRLAGALNPPSAAPKPGQVVYIKIMHDNGINGLPATAGRNSVRQDGLGRVVIEKGS